MVRSVVSPKFALVILCIGAFFDWASLGLIYPIFAAMIFEQDPIFLTTTSHAFKDVGLGVLMASAGIGQFFFSPVLGIISDQMGRKPILLLSYVIILIGSGLSIYAVWAQVFALLVIGRFITGIGGGNLSVINSAIADFSLPNEKAKHYAFVAMASGMGFSIGPFIGGTLVRWGYDFPFIFSGCFTIATFLVVAFFFPETYSIKRKGKIHLLPNFSLLRNVRIPFVAFFAFFFGWSFYWEFIPVTWIVNYGLPVFKIGNLYAYGSIFYVLSSGLFIQPLIRTFSGRVLLPIAWVLLGTTFIVLFRARIDFFWFLIPIQQFLISMIYPLGTALVSNATTEKQQGEMLGAYQSMQSFAFAITPFVSGILLELGYNTPLIVGSVGAFLACAIFLFYKK